jgi:hypothetical protein
MNTPRYAAAGFGANAEASIIAGGSTSGGPGNASTELWNGSSWTELNDLNSARYNFKGFGISTQGVWQVGLAQQQKMGLVKQNLGMEHLGQK